MSPSAIVSPYQQDIAHLEDDLLDTNSRINELVETNYQNQVRISAMLDENNANRQEIVQKRAEMFRLQDRIAAIKAGGAN